MDSNNDDRPHASTRRVKERRPTYHTKGARSIAALEQRVAELGNRQSTSAFPSTTKTAAAMDLDAEFNSIEQTSDALEERIRALENAKTSANGFHAQLQSLEQRIRPYEKYESQVLEAVSQLSKVQEHLRRTLGPTKADDRLSIEVTAHSKSIQTLEERLKQVEDLAELAKAQPLSTVDLGRALLHRVQRGDRLDATVSRDLRAALEAAADSTDHGEPGMQRDRMPETPLTDEGPGMQDSTEEPVEDEEPPLKRSRVEQTPHSAKKKALQTGQAKSSITGKGVLSSTPIKESTALEYPVGDEDAKGDVNMGEAAAPAEPRRTGRAHKPIQLYDMLPWKDANERLKGNRKSLG